MSPDTASGAPDPTSPDADRVYRKVGRRLIPLLFVCYIAAYLDRVDIGFAKLQMQNALQLGDVVYGLGAGIFFIGYFVLEVPSGVIKDATRSTDAGLHLLAALLGMGAVCVLAVKVAPRGAEASMQTLKPV